MYISKSKILLIFIILLVALALSACTGGGGTTGTPSVGAPGVASPTVISGTVTSTVTLTIVGKSLQDASADLNLVAQQADRLSPSDLRTILLQISGTLTETGTLVQTLQPCEAQLTGSQKQTEQSEAQRTNTTIQNNRIIILQTAGIPTPTPTGAAGVTASPTATGSPSVSPTSMVSPTATMATPTLTPVPTDTPTPIPTDTPTTVAATPTVVLASPTMVSASPSAGSPTGGTPGIGGPGAVQTPSYGGTESPTPWPSPTSMATVTPVP